MENKMNIAELLKNCPKGMELDSPVWDNIVFEEIDRGNIVILRKHLGTKVYLTQYGKMNSTDGKCVIFPKGKTTWEGFQKPFNDGDIITCTNSSCAFVAIYQCMNNKDSFYRYACLILDERMHFSPDNVDSDFTYPRFATEEEKKKLFKAIKDNGYRWNAETKTLEKLIVPNFKVGDVIQNIDAYKVKITEVNIEDECYGYESIIAKGIGSINFSEQDNWKLVPNKFDITTLKPFDKVLVRYSNGRWHIGFFEKYDKKLKYPFVCMNNNNYKKCIPYESNEHLLDTTNDCDEYYKTW